MSLDLGHVVVGFRVPAVHPVQLEHQAGFSVEVTVLLLRYALLVRSLVREPLLVELASLVLSQRPTIKVAVGLSVSGVGVVPGLVLSKEVVQVILEVVPVAACSVAEPDERGVGVGVGPHRTEAKAGVGSNERRVPGRQLGRVVVQRLIEHPETKTPEGRQDAGEGEHECQELATATCTPPEKLFALGVVAEGRKRRLRADIVFHGVQLLCVLDNVIVANSVAVKTRFFGLLSRFKTPPKLRHGCCVSGSHTDIV